MADLRNKFTGEGAPGGEFQVGVGKNDHRVFTAEFEDYVKKVTAAAGKVNPPAAPPPT